MRSTDEMATQQKKITVGASDAGSRIDHFLAKNLAIPRSQVHKLIDSGNVSLCAGVCSKASLKIEEGQEIVVCLMSHPSAGSSELLPTPHSLSIVFEDEDVIVIDKPTGMMVHAAPGGKGEFSLVNALLYHTKGKLAPNNSSNGEQRPGIVHRLDADTTGLIVAAKSPQALHGLMQQFRSKTARRFYQALALGTIKNDEEVEAYFFRNPVHRTQYLAISPEKLEAERDMFRDVKMRWAKSAFHTIETFQGKISLVEVELFTGRTHQVRLHAKMLGIPILGDKLYGSKDMSKLRVFSPRIRDEIKKLHGQLLHAYKLQFAHPITREHLEFECGLPSKFLSVLQLLREENEAY